MQVIRIVNFSYLMHTNEIMRFILVIKNKMSCDS